jgi:hypothetical protein
MVPSLEILSRWHHSAENLSTSAFDFYDSIGKAVGAKQLPVEISRAERSERGILSAKRQYLQIRYDRYVFVLSAFPFGKDYYFGWWLGKRMPNLAALGCGVLVGLPLLLIILIVKAGLVGGLVLFFIAVAAALSGAANGAFGDASDLREALSSLPWFGPIYRRLFNPATFYTEETRTIFEETVHRVVLDVLAGVLTIAKMTPLTDAQKQAAR